jgi:prophage DNA circulation protein
MADIWEERGRAPLIECSYGGLRLDVQTTSDTNGRTLATHAIPHREGAAVRDQGAVPRVTQCHLVFFPLDATDDPRERFALFKALADRGAHTFVHPISGSFRAYVGDLTWSAAAEPRETISVDCSFHEDSDQPATFDEVGAGLPTGAGVADVQGAAADLNDGLVEVNDELDPDEEPLTTTVGDACVAQAQDWEAQAADLEDPLTLRKVSLQLVALSNLISAETDRLELVTNPQRWPIARGLSNLHASVRRAAATFTQESPRIIEITTTVTTNVFTLAARTYPGDAADRRAEQIMGLNDIPNPARIEAGTRLKAYASQTSTRLRTPRIFGR